MKYNKPKNSISLDDLCSEGGDIIPQNDGMMLILYSCGRTEASSLDLTSLLIRVRLALPDLWQSVNEVAEQYSTVKSKEELMC